MGVLENYISSLIKRFGEDAKIETIAQYAEDEYMIPYELAVKLIYESIE
ncbi:hypothetical protein ABEW32_03425 [Paenibacillus jamilae]